MSISIFELPHLNETITHHLTANELYNCVLVSKDWFSWFIPSLWHHINLRRTSNLTALARHREHVRSITIGSTVSITNFITLMPFPSLKSLVYATIRTLTLEDSKVMEILPELPSLRSLSIKIVVQKEDYDLQFFEAVASHPNLKQLDLTVSGVAHPMFIPHLLKACRRQDSLKLDFSGILMFFSVGESEGDQYLLALEAIDTIEELSLRNLMIGALDEAPLMLISILKRCPLLERLRLTRMKNQEALQQLAVSFQENNMCPRLKHLSIVESLIPDAAIHSIVDILRAIGHNYYNQAESTNGNETGLEKRRRRERTSLESFSASTFAHYQSLTRTLIEFHAETLTLLDLSYQSVIEFQYLVDCVSSLPLLRSLSAAVSLEHRVISCASGVKASLQKPWSCVDLEELQLQIILYEDAEQLVKNMRKDTLVGQCRFYIFSQIAKLEKLREWRIRCGSNILKLELGYLNQLSNLKQLTSLIIDGSSNFTLNEEEATWMVENWTRLVHVQVTRRTRENNSLQKSFMTTLLEKRPWMHVI